MTLSQLLFGRPRPGSPAVDAGLLIFRVVAGAALLLFHGMGKMPPSEGLVGMVGGMGLPAPGAMAWLAAFAEFGGGLLLALGLLTRPISLLLLGHFTIVILLAHAGQSLSDRELPILFLATAALFFLAGPGRFSVDGLIRRA